MPSRRLSAWPAVATLELRSPAPRDRRRAPRVRARRGSRAVRAQRAGPARAHARRRRARGQPLHRAWDARDANGRPAAPGVYWAHLTLGDHSVAHRFVLIQWRNPERSGARLPAPAASADRRPAPSARRRGRDVHPSRPRVRPRSGDSRCGTVTPPRAGPSPPRAASTSATSCGPRVTSPDLDARWDA